MRLVIDPSIANPEGYRIANGTISASTETGLLYGAYALLRGESGYSEPFYKLRLLNHWDNLDGSIERGYAGKSIFWIENGKLKIENDATRSESSTFNLQSSILKQYALANASIGINGTVLNNVNASPKMLTRAYINKVKESFLLTFAARKKYNATEICKRT